jgi:hypothetical protein
MPHDRNARELLKQGSPREGFEVSPVLRQGLAELVKAHDYAGVTDRDVWEFAVEIRQLRGLQLTESDFRWLICAGYLLQAREETQLEDPNRRFRPVPNLAFSEQTCFVLTEKGVCFARDIVSCHELPEEHIGPSAQWAHQPCSDRPVWDGQRRELRVRGVLVKQFRSRAINQETILAAFEEEDWPPRIDDPLPPQPEQDAKRRLHDTIKCLNRVQTRKLIHFHGDGTGEGVLWSLPHDGQPWDETPCPCAACPLHEL